MALKKLEERTKSLDFGQGHTGKKRHHNNLSSLLEFSDNVGALVNLNSGAGGTSSAGGTPSVQASTFGSQWIFFDWIRLILI